MKSRKKQNKVYVGLSADILHKGHINILKIASSYGEVTVGLLTDEAIASYKKFPHLNYEQREIVLRNIKFVKNVIPQTTLDYIPNLKKIKPNFVVHGDDWKKGVQKNIRKKVIKELAKWSGKLIEPKYTLGISSSEIKKNIFKYGVSVDTRKSKLKRLMEAKPLVRIMESHNALTGLIIESSSYTIKNLFKEFDGMWSSSLTDSLTRGKPDNQSVDYSSRIHGLNEMLDVTSKPVIFDADNGGRLEHISFLVKTLERAGVSAVVFEDKVGLKKNSLFKDQKNTEQDSIEGFCKKLKKAKNSKISNDLLIVARVESLILGKGIKDAVKRAENYSKAGADAILIHSKEKNPKEIFKFAKIFKKSKFFKPLVAVPSTYSSVKESDLIKHHFKIVIYANQLLRAAYPSMKNAALSILKNERSFELEGKISSIKEVISLIKE